ncbi:type II toxin-antitoxin system PemK/MazF family toxin [Rossellomorea marisflavi]|uniref:type II toxin-antitoxin system PemK/MazF family toxin n=1 Tax=Rossellomorea marisflavi TaxID=189381 RepID=UPI003FA05F85
MKKLPYTNEEMQLWIEKVQKYTTREKTTTAAPKRGDIWTMDFGITVGSEIRGVRPVVVVSSSIVNEKVNTILVAPISKRSLSETDSTLDFHMHLEDDVFEWGKNTVEGIIKTESITTLSKGRMGKRVGRLNSRGLDELTRITGKILHVAEPLSPEAENEERKLKFGYEIE